MTIVIILDNMKKINPLDDLNLRKFYDELYKREQEENPAYQIYDQLRVNYIRQLLNEYRERVLIIGCGARQDANIFDQRVYAFDLSWYAVNRLKKHNFLRFVGNSLDIPLPNNSFDVIVCSEVLEHIPDIDRAVREIYRIIKPSGILIVSSPNWHSLFGLVRWIAEKVLRKSIHSSGQIYDDWKTLKKYTSELFPYFKVEKIRGVWYLPPLHYREKGLSASWVNLIYKAYSPLENYLSKFLPAFGHLIILRLRAEK